MDSSSYISQHREAGFYVGSLKKNLFYFPNGNARSSHSMELKEVPKKFQASRVSFEGASSATFATHKYKGFS